MKQELTPLQTKLLQLAESRDLGAMTYRAIATLMGGEHPYTVQLAIQKLIKAGKLSLNKRSGAITLARNMEHAKLLSIPVLGRVSCGVATEIADTAAAGFITVSPSIVDARYAPQTFALVAAGDSMDRADVNGNPVEDGDYVIVRKSEWGEAKDGQYVVSRYNEANNLKRLRLDADNRRIILLSESNDPRPPIIIAEEDLEYFGIEGVAIDVVKRIPGLEL